MATKIKYDMTATETKASTIFLTDKEARIPVPVESGNGPYHICVVPGKFMVITLGFILPLQTTTFDHPNLARRNVKILEFKHYRENGSKFWTAHAGVELSFIVPKDKIEIILAPHYSYVKALIGGRKFTFSVSGGSSRNDNGWEDWLGNSAHVGCNHPLRDVKALAAVSVDPKEYANYLSIVPFYTEDPKMIYDKYDIEHDRRADWLKAAAAKLMDLSPGNVVKLDRSVSQFYSKLELKIESRSKNGMSIIVSYPNGSTAQHIDPKSRIRVSRTLIDAAETAKAQNIKIEFPKEFSKLPPPKED